MVMELSFSFAVLYWRFDFKDHFMLLRFFHFFKAHQHISRGYRKLTTGDEQSV